MSKVNLIKYTILLVLLTTVSSVFAKEILLGEQLGTEEPLSVEVVLKTPKKYTDKQITIQGDIVKVCKKRGCWADFSSGNKQLRVKVKDGEIEIPLYAIGRKAYASGTLKAIQMDKEQTIAYLEHMAKDAGEQFDAKSITKGMILYQLKSNAIKIL